MKNLLILFLLACTPSSDEAFKKEAQEYIKPFKVELMSALTTGIQEKGPLEAMHSCNVLAPEILKKFERDRMAIGRTSHKIRNPKNTPAEWMKPLLEEYKNSSAKNPMEGRILKTTNYIAYVEPIYVQKICLTCHGNDIPDALREGIQSKYPGDQAIGFSEGEFRGLFWVRKEI